jgi:ABC-2 type transport system permease protein
MNRSLHLMSPRVLSFRNRIRRGQEGSGLRVLVMSVVAVGFWVGIFYGFSRVLGYFQAAEGFGDMLARKLMGMTWLTFLGILLFSNVITALNTFFLSKDLETIHSAPVETEDIFWARFVDTLVDSSWMVVFFGLPVFLAYGVVYGAGFNYYLYLGATALPIMIMATSMAVMFTMVLVNAFPARRTKDILLLLSIMAVILLYLMFRLMRPERLVNPDDFSSAVRYFAALSTPSSPYLPHHWASEILWPSLAGGYSEAGFHLAMMTSTALAMAVFSSWAAQALYPNGFSKSQEGARQFVSRFHPVDFLVKLLSKPFQEQSRVLIAKDVRTFFRDNTQWSQLLLLLALIVIYLYNFSVLDLRRYPIRTFYLQNIISFLNIGLAAFVVASLGVRFVFPAVSQEGFSYWIIRSSPVSLRRFLWTKFWIYTPPLIVVAEILIVLSNYLLDVSPIMMAVSTITVFFLVIGLVSLGIGLGAIYPRFEAENMAQVATGFGGMIFMILSALYVAAVVILEAWPVSVFLRSQAGGLPLTWWRIMLIAACFTAVLAINAAALFLPMRYGRRHLLARETI